MNAAKEIHVSSAFTAYSVSRSESDIISVSQEILSNGYWNYMALFTKLTPFCNYYVFLLSSQLVKKNINTSQLSCPWGWNIYCIKSLHLPVNHVTVDVLVDKIKWHFLLYTLILNTLHISAPGIYPGTRELSPRTFIFFPWNVLHSFVISTSDSQMEVQSPFRLFYNNFVQ